MGDTQRMEIPAKCEMTKEAFLRDMKTILTEVERCRLSLLYDLGASLNESKSALIGERVKNRNQD